MSEGSIELRDGVVYRPWGTVFGKVSGGETAGEVRLFWKTCGRGTEEVGVVDAQPIGDSGEFQLELPGAPYSVNGGLVGIEWFVEWVDERRRGLCLVGIVVSPEGRVVELGKVEAGFSEKAKKRNWGLQWQ